MAGYNHSQECLEQNLDLGILMRQAFARSTQYFSATVRRNAFCTTKNLKRALNTNTELPFRTFNLEKLKNVSRSLVCLQSSETQN